MGCDALRLNDDRWGVMFVVRIRIYGGILAGGWLNRNVCLGLELEP